MRHRFFGSLSALAVVTAAVVWAPVFVAAQAPSAAAKAAKTTPKTWTLPRTPWGDPDLQGYWSSVSFLPMERPVELGLKEFYTEDEAAAAFKKNIEHSYEFTFGHPAEYPTYNANIYAQNAWQNGVRSSLRTSVIKDPPNGRMPPLKAGQAERAQVTRGSEDDPTAARGVNGAEDLDLGVRCVFLGNSGPPIGPTSAYDGNHLIAQGPGFVMVEYEWGSGVQIIPLDGRPPLPRSLNRMHGESRGHWEGNTLVVETTNFRPIGGANASARLTERFTRVSADTLRYEFTVDDPARTRPWTGELDLNGNEGPMLEYACAEGNNGLINILEGARAEEKTAEQAAKKGSK